MRESIPHFHDNNVPLTGGWTSLDDGALSIVDESGFDLRFGGISRLYGAGALERLRAAHVAVVGIGGVGSWAVEALARSGVGRLTLIDLDDVCITNVNRQLHAVEGAFGRPKVQAMADRVRLINPELAVEAVQAFFTAGTARAILARQFDLLIDAIDHPAQKCLLISSCLQHSIPVVTTGGAGGRRDPTAVRTADLARSTHDALLQEVRRRLRRDHGFPRGGEDFGVPCVYSVESQVFPMDDGTICSKRPKGTDLRLDCESGYGTATQVTGTFGFAAAAVAVRRLLMASGLA